MVIPSLKYDLCMWTKNGERWLSHVMKRIDEVIPSENVNHKILVDDKSVDQTVEIAKDFNWVIYDNPRGGISAAANEALRHIETEAFISFEQDLLLSRDWFNQIPPLLDKGDVAVASGVHYETQPRGIRLLWKRRATQFAENAQLRDQRIYHLGMSLDNTIWKTKVVKCVGGFPQLKTLVGFDVLFSHILHYHGWKWVVDYTVISDHLRTGLRDALKHRDYSRFSYWEIWSQIKRLTKEKPVAKKDVLIRLFLCVPIGAYLALKLRESTIGYIYPIERFVIVNSLLKSGAFLRF